MDFTAITREELRALATRALVETEEGRALLREQLQREERGEPKVLLSVDEA